MSRAAYDQIGHGYDATRRADPGILSALLKHLEPIPGATLLDLACGTANYTSAIAENGHRIVGTDLSQTMLSQAAVKSPHVPFVCGDAAALPFADAAFDGALCTLALHHFRELQPVFTEVRRILAQGNFVIFTSTPEQMQGYWLSQYFPAMIEASRELMPTWDQLKRELSAAGFVEIRFIPWSVPASLEDYFLYSGKHHPERYLDPSYRAGISSFHQLVNTQELESGLGRLADDPRSGAFTEVADSFNHTLGDYLFVIARI